VRAREEWSSLRPHEISLLNGMFGAGGGVPDPVEMSDLAHRFYKNLSSIRSGIFRELMKRGYYDRRPDTVMGAWIGGGFVVGVLGVVGGLWLADALTLSPVTAVLAAVGTALPIVGFGLFMPARTVKGARVLEQVLGFEEFLERVESDRYKRMITSPEMFERFLPYAMAFGVEKKWASAFEDIYREPPDWYRGQWGSGGFRPVYFAHSMGQMSTAASSVMSSGPRSSGGSGFGGGGFSGGGFSGGGFGGGGGGGW